MTNLTNALLKLNSYIDPEATPLDGALHLLETTPDPEDVQPVATDDDWGVGKWCEVYRGSGRLTGHTTDTPTRTADGEVVGFVWYDDAEQFGADFLWQQHDCHSSPQWDCPHCN